MTRSRRDGRRAGRRCRSRRLGGRHRTQSGRRRDRRGRSTGRTRRAGRPRLCEHTGFGMRDLRRVLSGPAYARRWVERAVACGVDIRTRTMVTGWAAPGRAEVTGPDGLLQMEARAVVLATGARERPRAARLVPGTRPSGIFTTGQLQQWVHREHLPVGRRAAHRGRRACLLLRRPDPARSRRPPGGARHGPPAPPVLSALRPRDPVRPQRAGVDRDVRRRRVRARQGGRGARPGSRRRRARR